jgi:catechol 2,3-dioxygenase-like lactoylglutathione lyase family enzyme
MTSAHIDLIEPVEIVCDDVPAGVSFFRDVLALPVRELDGRRAEVQLGPRLTACLQPRPDDQPVRRGHRGAGLILEIEVPEVTAAVQEIRRRGGAVLIEPVVTEWGTESAFVAGPGDLVVELYRPLPR